MDDKSSSLPKGCTNNSWFTKSILCPWLDPELGIDEQALLSSEESNANEIEAFRDSSSVLQELFSCCGFTNWVITKASKRFHVNLKRTPITQAKSHYKLDGDSVKALENLYSSFRIVLGDGECFYRSFIFSYLEQVLERNDTFEEEHILSAMQLIWSAYESLEWNYGFAKYYESFKALINKVKCWKSENRAIRRKNLLNFFEDYKESEDIFSFLRISAASWICTHDDIAAFNPTTDGSTIEQFCRKEIIARRSFAHHLAITGLTTALDIPLRVFNLGSKMNQDIRVQTLFERSRTYCDLVVHR